MDISTLCSFAPILQTGTTSNCGGGAGLVERCTASGSYILEAGNVLRVENIVQYKCTYKCKVPCETSPTVQLSECSVIDGVEICTPDIVNRQLGGVHDKKCTIDYSSTPEAICPNGETIVVYKDPELAAAIGQAATLETGEGFAIDVPVPCTVLDNKACGQPKCKCIDGCKSSPLCSGKGTYMESEFEFRDTITSQESPFFIPPVCDCNPGNFESFCQNRQPSEAPTCRRGQELGVGGL